jgi:archaemetzincin
VGLILLAPFGAPPDEVVGAVEVGLGGILGLEVKRLEARAEPPAAFDPKRSQWDSSVLLKALLDGEPAGEGRILGIAGRDLFVPVLTFVYGQAQLKGRAAVVSLARLRPEFYGLAADSGLLAERVVKEAVHEAGHTLGLVHCLDPACPMSLSIGLAELDRKGADPCRSCRALLEESLDLRRYRREGVKGE